MKTNQIITTNSELKSTILDVVVGIYMYPDAVGEFKIVRISQREFNDK